MASDRFWQTLPLDIELVKSEPRIADLSPAGRGGFVWLAMEQWRAEDGYLPANDEFLRQASGLREQWAANKLALLALFVPGENGLAYPPLRELWEVKLKAHLAMSEGAKRVNEARWGDRHPSGERGSLETPESLYVVGESIGSVIRACNGQAETGENRTHQFNETANTQSSLATAKEPETECQTDSAARVQGPRNASNSEVAPRHARAYGEVRFHGVDAASGRESATGGREVAAQADPVLALQDVLGTGGLACRDVHGRVVAVTGDGADAERVNLYSVDGLIVGSNVCVNGCGWREGCQRQVCDLCQGVGRDSEPKDENQGVAVPSTPQQEHLEAPSASFEGDFEGFDLSEDDLAEMDAARAQASLQPAQRGRRAPAPRFGRQPR